MGTKVCKKCGEEKEHKDFCKNKTCKDGITNECKKCKNLGVDREKKKIRRDIWKKKNAIKHYEQKRKSAKKSIEVMTDWYVIEKASRQLKCAPDTLKEFPEIVEGYKAIFKLNRAIKNHGKEQH